MLSKSQVSFVNALHHKKHRKEQGLFIAEGIKSITEFLQSDYSVDTIFCIPDATPKLSKFSQKIKLFETGSAELKKISALTTPQDAIALIRIPEKTNIHPESFKNRFTIVLDGVQDPGNLGTIIRTADWFGFGEIICSIDTVEAYNPKVVQATMGSLSRIRVHYTDLETLLGDAPVPVFGAMLDGQSVYEANLGNEGFLVLGNEGKGISEKVTSKIGRRITIPSFGKAESLNVAISAAILCSELRRRL
ncbi:TrmH family RNA methyltransferase [Arcticibacter tournemirensis]|uniref:RNA methyltransferase n=1 Tax=Arcticibacter tournemirensis TaxID=699437 RepID=A0A5M9HF41_9SPHI|nr:RNA methyltransferase [Arcticibacter tournemirensis]KAA8484985.1 RNA methyltransferase [Arcticibacter tournemirensis]TQM50568.1 TrmH family RNA methyltransferase [Arcticibacter tournemirensis]